jgi:hypothetical protein
VAAPTGEGTSSPRLVERPTLVALGAAIALATLPYWEVLLGSRSAMYGDINDSAVPQYLEVWQAIGDGRWPWWTPGVFAGHSMVGAGQYAVFYPLNAIFGVLEPVTAYRWWLLAHLWIGAAGAFAWSWRRFGSRPGAVVSAVAYSGSGFAVLHLVHAPFVIAVAWLPLVFLGVDAVRERWSTRRAALVAVPLALIAIAGTPQMLWIALAGAAMYAVVLAVVDRGPGLGRIALATALGVGLGAVQLLPQWRFSRTSQRPSLSMDGAFEHAALPRHLLTFLFPWAFGGSTQGSVFSAPWSGGDLQHEVGSFAGITIVALAVLAVVRRRREPMVWALLVMSLVAVLIGLGGHTPFGRLFYDVLPLARSFRAWGRTTLLANLALAMLAGLGVRELRRAPERTVVGLAAAVPAIAAVALLLPHLSSLDGALAGGTYGAVARGLPVMFLLGLLAAAAVMALRPRLGAVALVAICSIEVLTFAYPNEWRGQSAPVSALHDFYDQDQAPSFGRPADAPGGVDRWASDTYGFRMVSLVKDLAGINGYDPLLQEDFAKVAGGFAYDGYPTRPDLWQPGWLADVLRVSTLVLGRDTHPTDPGWTRVRDVPEVNMVRWEREPRLPEAYRVGAAEVASLDEIRGALADPATALDTTAYVEDDAAGIAGLDAPGRSGRVTSVDVRDEGRIVVDAERDSLHVLSHGFESGWHASVDGRSTEVLRTNGLVLGIVVPKGHHVVRVGFHPPGLTSGAVLSVLSLIALIGGAPAVDRLRRRRAPAT